jgi:hypothetical protein
LRSQSSGPASLLGTEELQSALGVSFEHNLVSFNQTLLLAECPK